MSMRYTHDIVATVGKYLDSFGEEKNRYCTIGKAFKRDDGSACVKIEQIPIGAEFNGWANLYPKKDRNSDPDTTTSQAQGPRYNQATSQAANAAHMAAQAPSAPRQSPPGQAADQPFDDDIPF